MKKIQFLAALLGLALLTCISGVEGQYMNMQYPMMSSGYTTTSQAPIEYPASSQTYLTNQMMASSYTAPGSTSAVGYQIPAQPPQTGQTTGVSQYSQYYTMGPELAPNTHISAPQQINITNNTPTTVYFSYQGQPVAYSQYMSNPTYARINELWIKGKDSWAQYAQVPQGVVVMLLAVSPNGGNGYIREMDPNGQMYNYNYFFYPYSELAFNADTPGRHTISFGLAGQPSNHVEIDVIGEYNPPRYYNPPSYYGYYPYLGYGSDGFIGSNEGFNEGVGEGEAGFEGGEAGEGEGFEGMGGEADESGEGGEGGER
jgi:hypothetical protein